MDLLGRTASTCCVLGIAPIARTGRIGIGPCGGFVCGDPAILDSAGCLQHTVCHAFANTRALSLVLPGDPRTLSLAWQANLGLL